MTADNPRARLSAIMPNTRLQRFRDFFDITVTLTADEDIALLTTTGSLFHNGFTIVATDTAGEMVTVLRDPYETHFDAPDLTFFRGAEYTRDTVGLTRLAAGETLVMRDIIPVNDAISRPGRFNVEVRYGARVPGEVIQPPDASRWRPENQQTLAERVDMALTRADRLIVEAGAAYFGPDDGVLRSEGIVVEVL